MTQCPNSSRMVVGNEEMMDWELRPGGMLVQKRDEISGDGAPSQSQPLIKIKVSCGSSHHIVHVPAHSTFGNLKRVLAQETGLDPVDQRLFFRGVEKEDSDYLDDTGVKHLSKLLLMEDSASKERKLEETKRREQISRQCNAISQVREEVDKLGGKVVALAESLHGGNKILDKEFIILEELLMRMLLKLDGIEAEGEAKEQRKMEVRRVQSLEKALDTLKARLSNPFGNSSNAVSVTTNWETFESGVGSLSAPSTISPSTKTTEDWERFD